MDYYLVPGAPWSLLKSGERVRVVARMSGGWYRCIALRDANCQLGPDPSNTSLVVREGGREGGREREKRREGREGVKEEGRRGEGEREGRE